MDCLPILFQAQPWTATLHSLGFGCFFFDVDLDGNLDLLVVNGHIDDMMQKVTDTPYAQQAHLFLNNGGGRFAMWPMGLAAVSQIPKLGEAQPMAISIMMATWIFLSRPIKGRHFSIETISTRGNRSLRFRLVGRSRTEARSEPK